MEERGGEGGGGGARKAPVELVVGVVHAAALPPPLVGDERLGGVLRRRGPLAAARLRLGLRSRRHRRWCPGPRETALPPLGLVRS